jgi:hypothetical protein
MKADALPQCKRPGPSVIGDAPGLGKARYIIHMLIIGHERVKERSQNIQDVLGIRAIVGFLHESL